MFIEQPLRLNNCAPFHHHHHHQQLLADNDFSSMFTDDVVGMTTITDAASRGDVTLVQRLLSMGVDVDDEDVYRRSALYIAAARGDPAMCNVLIAAQASVCRRNGNSATALHAAAQTGSVQCAQILIKQGADVAARTDNGDTALHFACYHRHAPLVNYLLRAGANATVKNNQKMTPMDEAKLQGCSHSVDLLKNQDRFCHQTWPPKASQISNMASENHKMSPHPINYHAKDEEQHDHMPVSQHDYTRSMSEHDYTRSVSLTETSDSDNDSIYYGKSADHNYKVLNIDVSSSDGSRRNQSVVRSNSTPSPITDHVIAADLYRTSPAAPHQRRTLPHSQSGVDSPLPTQSGLDSQYPTRSGVDSPILTQNRVDSILPQSGQKASVLYDDHQCCVCAAKLRREYARLGRLYDDLQLRFVLLKEELERQKHGALSAINIPC